MPADLITQRLQIVEARMLERAQDALEQDAPLPFDELSAAFQLSGAELRAVAVMLFLQTNTDLLRLCRVAWSDFTQKQPTVAFLLELVCDLDTDDVHTLTVSLRSGGRLHDFLLLRLFDVPGWAGECPLSQKVAFLPERIERFLTSGRSQDPIEMGEQPGRDWWLDPPPPRLEEDDAFSPAIPASIPASSVETSPASPSTALTAAPTSLVFAEGVEASILAALGQRSRANLPRLVLYGRSGSGRRSLLRQIAHSEGHPLLILDLQRWLDNHQDPTPVHGTEDRAPRAPRVPLHETIQEVVREAMLHQAIILIRDADLLERDAATLGAARRALEALDAFPHRLILTTKAPLPLLRRHLRFLTEVGLPTLPEDTQRALWEHHLAPLPSGEREQFAAALARQYAMTPGGISRAIDQAQSRPRAAPPTTAAARRAAKKAPPAPTLRTEDVLHAVRAQFDHNLSTLAEPIATQMRWQDLILPPQLMEDLDEILNIMRHRHIVYDLWGFRAKLDTGRGLACLFSGPPGTGKTMTASLLARELGREAYRVDLSRIVDKYIGETEKNLGRIFDEAERAQAILLFDEADSLFAKRTEVKSSNDRYANLEVNFLLQRLERFDGISILTTNFESSIDDAFKRRIRFRIQFPFPDPAQRVDLWRAMIPSQAHIEPDINWSSLAKSYEIAGGNIKNAVLRAAFEAARFDSPITEELLHKAGNKECREMGQLVRD
jgi:hypothetical protein